MNAERTTRSLEHLGLLTTHVERLAGKFPLRDHPTLRSQMRRSAIDSLAHAACGLEAVSEDDLRRLLCRSLAALTELETYARLARRAGALTPTEEAQVLLLTGQAGHSVKLCLDLYADAPVQTEVGRSLLRKVTAPAVALSGAA
ncbi:MAG: hypothetical protein Kow00129_06850 [Thermoleophilia bacterium]